MMPTYYVSSLWQPRHILLQSLASLLILSFGLQCDWGWEIIKNVELSTINGAIASLSSKRAPLVRATCAHRKLNAINKRVADVSNVSSANTHPYILAHHAGAERADLYSRHQRMTPECECRVSLARL